MCVCVSRWKMFTFVSRTGAFMHDGCRERGSVSENKRIIAGNLVLRELCSQCQQRAMQSDHYGHHSQSKENGQKHITGDTAFLAFTPHRHKGIPHRCFRVLASVYYLYSNNISGWRCRYKTLMAPRLGRSGGGNRVGESHFSWADATLIHCIPYVV